MIRGRRPCGPVKSLTWAGALFLLTLPAALHALTPPTAAFITPFDADTFGVAIAVDGAGNSYVAAETFRGGVFASQVIKLSTAGAVLGKSAEFNPGGFFTLPRDIAVDSTGNSYVTADNLDTGRGLLLRYNPDGVLIQTAVAPFSGSPFFPVLRRIVYDPVTRHLYATENFINPVTGVADTMVLEYDTGLNLLTTSQPFQLAFGDQAHALSLDTSGNVYVGGDQTVFTPSGPSLVI